MLNKQESEEIVKSPADCSLLGRAAEQNGNNQLAISLFKHAAELDPNNIGHKFNEIATLMKINSYEEAYKVTEEAEKTQSIPNLFSLRKVEILYITKNWTEIILNAKPIIEKFAPENNKISANIARYYLVALRENNEISRAAAEVNKYVAAIGKHVNNRNIFFDCLFAGLYDQAANYARIVAARTDSDNLNGVNLDNLLLYVDMVAHNAEWVRAHAPDVKLVSLGQNCLPFSLTKRFGLNTIGMSEENVTVFDLGGASNNITAKLLKTDFVDLLNRDLFTKNKLPKGIPMMRHKGNGMVFFHEAGECRIGPNADRFHRELNISIDNYRRVSSEGKRLFIYSVVGPCDLDDMIEVWTQKYPEETARLLIIDSQKEPISFTQNQEIRYVHIPYPEGYNWNFAEDYTTERGRAFEREIATAVRNEMLILQNITHPMPSLARLKADIQNAKLAFLKRAT